MSDSLIVNCAGELIDATDIKEVMAGTDGSKELIQLYCADCDITQLSIGILPKEGGG